MRKTLIVHYDEIALKGRNRGAFESRLMQGIQRLLDGAGRSVVTRLYGRLLVDPGLVDLPPEEVVRRLARLPGVRYVLEGVATDQAWESLLVAVDAVLPGEGVRTFGVRAKRADKTYPRMSLEIERELGAHILAQRDWTVDLSSPDLWLRVEIVNGRGLVCTTRHDGPGGLPTGSSGRAVTLLSGGIDSPVAAWMMMTRGLALTCLHFHSAPHTNQRSQDKVRELCRLLSRFQAKLNLVMIPFADPIQAAVVQQAPQRYRVILYRRFMMRVACRAAAAVRARSIVTGESVGQVASQTVENMTTVQAVSSLPVLRPLVGLGKSKIIDAARAIGTYETSILPHDDCCSYLMPRSPATRSTPDELQAVEEVFDVDALVDETWSMRETEGFKIG